MATSISSQSMTDRTKSLGAVWNIIEPLPAGAASAVDGHQPSFSNEQAIRILKRGISSRVIEPLSEYLSVGKGELVGILDLDRTTLLRRATRDQPLPTHSAENVLRVLELKDAAIATFETEAMALDWMRRPHPMLDGESPLESAATSFGARRVRDILLAIQYGGVV
jgi:putative toxin-antitoxin system antitoxin component (TIGR02293 family)